MKTAILIAVAAIVFVAGYQAGQQTGGSKLRFEMNSSGEYMLDRITGQQWIQGDNQQWQPWMKLPAQR